MNTDFSDLLNIFNANEVRYLIVGAYAVMKYSEPRFTKDLDIWIQATSENAERVFRSLQEFGAPLDGLTADDFAADGFFQMGRPPVRVDILMSLDGVEFETAWSNRAESLLGDVSVNVIGLEDLITNKRASARPQDLIDLDNLNLIRN